MNVDKLEEVFSFLEQHEMGASSVIVDGDRVELHGLHSTKLLATNWDSLKKKPKDFDRSMLFKHTGIVPEHRPRDPES